MTLQTAELGAPFASAASVEDAADTISTENMLTLPPTGEVVSAAEVIAREREERTDARAFDASNCGAVPASAAPDVDASKSARYMLFATVA